jgi:hypothetical protein
MTFYVAARNRNPSLNIRVHPLLLSLTAAIDASETNPDIKAISETDERALRSEFYTSHSTLPPLEIHFSGQNGPSFLSNQNSYSLTGKSLAVCRECWPSASQNNSGGTGNATKGAETEGDITLVEELKNEVAALKLRCNALEKTVEGLQSICNTHQRYIETLRKEIISIHKDRGTLDLNYQGEEFEAM